MITTKPANRKNNRDPLAALVASFFEEEDDHSACSCSFPNDCLQPKKEQNDQRQSVFNEAIEMMNPNENPLKIEHEPLHIMSSSSLSTNIVAQKKTMARPTASTTVSTKRRDHLSSMLNDYDVICGRSKLAFNHVGNRRFRVTISIFLKRYFEFPSRLDRSVCIFEIIDTIHEAGGRFLKEAAREEEWVELNQKEQRNKVGHALRDAAAVFLRNSR